ncbi:MAG TPA: hypothetical protein VMT04_04045 [Terriglobales bacterium]|nr:hypothetical protein [Terriglobales bacterium]
MKNQGIVQCIIDLSESSDDLGVLFFFLRIILNHKFALIDQKVGICLLLIEPVGIIL